MSLGIRPEHLVLGDCGAGTSFEAGVEVIEQLSSEVVLTMTVGEARLTVSRINAETGIRVGDLVRLSMLPERMHFFDPATERAIV